MSQAELKTEHVWIVEDNESYRNGLAKAISSCPPLKCTEQFGSAEDMFIKLDEGELPDVILFDIQLPGMDGLSALKQISQMNHLIKTIVLTAFDDDDKIFSALCNGASGYLLKSALRSEINTIIQDVLNGGAPMSPSVAKKVLEKFNFNSTLNSHKYKLSEREVEVLRLMADGLVKKEIGEKLFLSRHTISSHIRHIYDKLHVDTNTGAVAKAIREHLI